MGRFRPVEYPKMRGLHTEQKSKFVWEWHDDSSYR